MQLSVQFHGARTGGRLFVLVHGWQHAPKNLADLIAAVRESFPEDDVLLPCYPSSTWSNGDLCLVAEYCVQQIQEAWEKHRKAGYREVVLIGHSLGALLARKTYLIAHGKYSEYPIEGAAPEKREWADRIQRLVLLSGMNRGWKLYPKNKYTPPRVWLWRLLLLTAARVTHRGTLVRSAYRGAPFVVNLRLDWLELMHAGVQPALVVQLAGTRDTVIDPTDHIDLLSGANFRYLSVEGTSHHAMVRFDDTEAGRERKRKFLRALQDAPAVLKNEISLNVERPDPDVQQVVLLLHGIRDQGGWTEELLKEIEAGGALREQKVKGRIGNYGYLPLLPFLVGLGRRRHLLQFMDLYAEARAAFPKAKCSFVGHSNGTYLMATALSRYVSCRFDRVAFIGCILHRRFGWIDRMSGRVGRVRNYVATDDWVVAIFPSFFESVRIFPFNRDFGSAGHTGFTQVSDRFENVRFIEGDHGAGLETRNRPALLSFLLADEPETAPLIVPAQRARTVTLHKMCTYIWILLLAGVVALFYGATRLNGYMGYPWPVVQALYVLVLIFVFFRY
ncbi:MAG TPA: alpha/beta fold hydrolase [Bryobacteraceae bacterium]